MFVVNIRFTHLTFIVEGRNVPGLEKFDLCFGGRRQFCDVEYADLGMLLLQVTEFT